MSDLAESLKSLPEVIVSDVEDVILRESLSVLKQVVETQDSCRLEMANFLVCIRGIKHYWRIPESFVRFLTSPLRSDQKGIDYFLCVSILYFVGDRVEYRQLQSEILNEAVARIDAVENLLADTELMCLSLDLMSCPWVPHSSKKVIAKRVIVDLGTPNPRIDEVNAFVNEFCRETWFFDWRSTVSNSIYLQKKELSLSY